jgi:hypothetical protein
MLYAMLKWQIGASKEVISKKLAPMYVIDHIIFQSTILVDLYHGYITKNVV